MYLVFIAMMALNVSSEVLDGFDLVEEGLQQTIKSTDGQNEVLLGRMQESYTQNPVKTEQWHTRAMDFKQRTDSLYNHIQSLKVRIVQKADGKDGNVNKIDNKENLDAAPIIMLSPLDNQGRKLKGMIDSYREYAASMLSGTRKTHVEERLNTEVSKRLDTGNKNWEQTLFEQMPTAAAVTLLTKIQSDIRAVEGDVLGELLSNVGADDYRVNSLEARVIPESRFVTQGSSYRGQIILAAVDTTKRPRFVPSGGTINEDGTFNITASGIGERKFTGNVYLSRPGKEDQEVPFSADYTVIEPMATVAPRLMNVLYAGYPNEIDISVPGVPNNRIRASVANASGQLESKGNFWVARPGRVGQEMIISVTADFGNGRFIEVAKKPFQVRKLPDPLPYIEYADANGTPNRFKGGRINKAIIVNTSGLKAAMDDGVLNIQFEVLRFTIVFTDGMNSIREISDGANFSERQKAQIRRLSKGRSFFITDVQVKAPEGPRDIPSAMEVRIN